MTSFDTIMAFLLLQGRAYIPFLDPLPLDTYWLLLLPPLAIIIALVYKAIHLEDLTQLPRQAALMATQIVVFMAVAAAVLWLVTELA